MKRLAAILLRVATAGSMALCVAVCALWVRSETHPDDVDREFASLRCGVRSAHGRLEVWRGIDPWDLMDSADPYRPPNAVLGALGVEHANWTWRPPPGELESRGLRFPHALPAVLAAVLPFAAMTRRLVNRVRSASAGRRGRAGLCRNCRYDLRASPARCPECGTLAANGGNA